MSISARAYVSTGNARVVEACVSRIWGLVDSSETLFDVCSVTRIAHERRELQREASDLPKVVQLRGGHRSLN